MRYSAITVFIGALALTIAHPKISAAEMLISEAESKLPQASDSPMATRGITRGPGIELVSPAPGTQNVNSPVPLNVKFVARNNIPIDPASVKLTYLRSPTVDLTDRVKRHVSKDGIDMPQADVPAGNHIIRIDLKDAEGRATSTTITLVVAK